MQCLARERRHPAACQGLSKRQIEAATLQWAGQTLPQLARLVLGTHVPGTPTKPAAEEQVLPRFPGSEGFLNNMSMTGRSFAHSPGGSYVYLQSCLAWWGCEHQRLTCIKAELEVCKESLLKAGGGLKVQWGPLWVLEFCKKRFTRDKVVLSSCWPNLPYLYRATSLKDYENPIASLKYTERNKCFLLAEIKVRWHMKKSVYSIGEITKPSALVLFCCTEATAAALPPHSAFSFL